MAEDAQKHELYLKEAANKYEKEWADFNKIKASTDEELKKQVSEMKESIVSLESKLRHEKDNNELNGKILSSYEDYFKKMNIKITADTQQTEKQ